MASSFIKLFDVVSMKASDEIELCLRLEPPRVAVYNPTPLRQFCPPNEKRKKRVHDESRGGGEEASDEIELSLRLEPPRVAVYNPTPLRQFRPPNEKRKKREHDESRGGGERSFAKRRRRAAEVEEPDTSIPPQLLEKVKSREPVFLYQRKLSPSDTKEHHSRLFVLEREGFERMLTEDERRILNGGRGLKNIVGVDTRGRSYRLGLTIWPSMNMLVINSSGWLKLVKQNDAKKGDWVQIWGHMGNLCLAINFIKD